MKRRSDARHHSSWPACAVGVRTTGTPPFSCLEDDQYSIGVRRGSGRRARRSVGGASTGPNGIGIVYIYI